MAEQKIDYSDAEQVAARDSLLKLQEMQDRDDLIKIMQTETGRRVIWRLLSRLRPFETAFNSNSERWTCFNLGTQQEGLFWFNELMTHCPQLYHTMVEEAKTKE